MRKYLLWLMAILFLAGCQSFDESQLENYEVKQTEDETVEGDFVFRVISEQKEYKEGEKVQLYGEIEYVGEKEEIIIHHSSSAIIFPMEEMIRGYEIGSAVNDIGLTTTLKKGIAYREDFVKSGGYSPNQDPQDYINFIDDFLERDDFPAGYYVVNAHTDFSDETGTRYNIRGEIDFKVVRD